MQRSQRTRASGFQSSLLVVALLMLFVMTTNAQIEESATIGPAGIAASGAAVNLNALTPADVTPATVVPAGGNVDERSATSSLANEVGPLTGTDNPANASPSTTPGAPAIETPLAGTTSAPATGATATTTAQPPEASTTAPAATEVLTPSPVTIEASTSPPAPGALPIAPPVPGELPISSPVPGALPIGSLVPGELPIGSPVPGELPIGSPVPGELPIGSPVPGELPIAPPPAAPAPTLSPLPVVTEAPTLGVVATDAPTTTPSPPAASISIADLVESTQAPTAAPVTPTEATTTVLPIVASSFQSTTGSSATDLASSSSSTSRKSAQESTDSNVPGTSGVLTFAPIVPDDTDTDTNTGIDTDTDTNAPINSYDGDSDITTRESQSFGDWKLGLVIVGAVCAVVASVFFVHKRHVRTAAANRRSRGSLQQRALESFFRLNRLTIARDTTVSVSSRNFITDPLTRRGEVAVTMPFQARPSTMSSELLARSAAQSLTRNTRLNQTSTSTPPDSYESNEYDSSTDLKSSFLVSSKTSTPYRSNSSYSDTSSVSFGSIAPSVFSSQRSLLEPSIFETGPRNTNRSKRSSTSNSSSEEDDSYRLKTHTSVVSSDKSYSSRMSDENFSVDESFTTELSPSNDSFITVESFMTQSTQDTDDNLSTTSNPDMFREFRDGDM